MFEVASAADSESLRDVLQLTAEWILFAEKAEGNEDAAAAQDTFAEKMVTQVIKNLQVTVRDIHVRYEDEYTNRERPFAAGFTLNELSFQVTPRLASAAPLCSAAC